MTGRARFLPAERRLVARLDTPPKIQRWLGALPYNYERKHHGAEPHTSETLRTFRGVVAAREAHCLEGALAAACLLEARGAPPVLLVLASDDHLDHAVVPFRDPRTDRWGALGKSKYPGLMGRRPVFRTLRELVWSYVDPFVDRTGRVRGYALADLRELPRRVDWRFGRGNVWAVDAFLVSRPLVRLRASDARHARWKRRYLAWKATHLGHGEPAEIYPSAARRRWM
ncbi:MAG: hypothetical protein ACYDCK_04715 [Thermoplasmatota archaeon]